MCYACPDSDHLHPEDPERRVPQPALRCVYHQLLCRRQLDPATGHDHYVFEHLKHMHTDRCTGSASPTPPFPDANVEAYVYGDSD